MSNFNIIGKNIYALNTSNELWMKVLHIPDTGESFIVFFYPSPKEYLITPSIFSIVLNSIHLYEPHLCITQSDKPYHPPNNFLTYQDIPHPHFIAFIDA